MTTITPELERRLIEDLYSVYGAEVALGSLHIIRRLIEKHPIPPRDNPLDERSVLLIAYGDHVHAEGAAPLTALDRFCHEYLRDLISGVHILPFYPFTSDDGFSVVDYLAVNPALGGWADIARLGADFRLMFDLVLNHISSASAWFQAFLRDEAPYRDYFITPDSTSDLAMVVRPRTHPLLTSFDTAAGRRSVWTTFSADQIDLNYDNPAVLLDMLDILLTYVERGADFVRLDAIAYLWKTLGTTCIHLPQTHAVVRVMRAVLDAAAPWVKLITETNVPHQDNITYFGDGANEASLVYQFALPPLTLHALQTGRAGTLSAWASTLTTPSAQTTFFNFTASHDGIGVQPARGLLAGDEIEAVIERVRAHGGMVSYKTNSDGSLSPYELNCTYFDALSAPGDPHADLRFIASQAIMLALAGVPGIYLPSLFGARNWQAGVRVTGHARTINRQKFDLSLLMERLASPRSQAGRVFRRYSDLLRLRRAHAAFHPNAAQRVLDVHPSVFAVERQSVDGAERVLALHNVSSHEVTITLPDGNWLDLQRRSRHSGGFALAPYQVAWLCALE
ncbi:MAG: alpha-amylase family glycosyl hydrolase [Anaerolineae bacterium]